MPNLCETSLHTLPTEVLHLIFDEITASNIILSLRNVCKRLRAVVHAYERYHLDLSSISYANFQNVCYFIRPECVASLILSDSNQTAGGIELFFSKFTLNQFTRLRSLTLLYISNDFLDTILPQITNSTLVALSIDTLFSISNRTVKVLLTETIGLRSIKLRWSNSPSNRTPIAWDLAELALEHITIRHCTITQWFSIFSCAPRLKSIVLEDYFTDEYQLKSFNFPSCCQCQQLKSLNIQNTNIKIKELELFLSFMPSLVHLKLIGYDMSLENKLYAAEWEELLEKFAPRLERFEFYFSRVTSRIWTLEDIDSYLTLFRTAFWLEKKRWFVACTYSSSSSRFSVYSIPICKSDLIHESHIHKISCSTMPSVEDDLTANDHVDDVTLYMTQFLPEIVSDNHDFHSHEMFSNATKLTIQIDNQWPRNTTKYLSTLIDLSKLVKFSLIVNFSPDLINIIDKHIPHLFAQTPKLRSVSIFFTMAQNQYTLDAAQIVFSMIPDHVQHLSVSVSILQAFKSILEKNTHRSSITFRFENFISREDINKIIADIPSVMKYRYRSSWHNSMHRTYLDMWLGQV